MAPGGGGIRSSGQKHAGPFVLALPDATLPSLRDVETWRRGDVETWRRGDVETRGGGDVETWGVETRCDVETRGRGDVET